MCASACSTTLPRSSTGRSGRWSVFRQAWDIGFRETMRQLCELQDCADGLVARVAEHQYPAYPRHEPTLIEARDARGT